MRSIDGFAFRPSALRRRDALLGMAGLLGSAGPARAAPALRLHAVETPEPMLQLAAGEGGALLAVGRSGRLWQLERRGAARELADGVDDETPLAVGHGQVAGRRRDGSLFVRTADGVGGSAGVALAPHAGLWLLPFGIVGIEVDGGGGRAVPVRLEPDGRRWVASARGTVEVLPDARPLQAALDGGTGGGHIVLLAGPDGRRYAHGVLGDAIEAARIVWLERHGLEMMRTLELPDPLVFEDIAPRRVVHAGRDALLTVISGPEGARLALVGADARDARSLTVLARGAPLGQRHRWMAPTTDGHHLLAVHTPHLGGVLHAYRADGARLVATRIAAGVANHRIGTRVLDQGSWSAGRLLLPAQGGRGLTALDARRAWAALGEAELPSPVVATVALPSGPQHAALLEDGRVLRVDYAA